MAWVDLKQGLKQVSGTSLLNVLGIVALRQVLEALDPPRGSNGPRLRGACWGNGLFLIKKEWGIG